MLSEINAIVAEVLKDRSLDSRTCYTSVLPTPPSATSCVFECSEPEVLEEVRVRLARRLGENAGPVRYVRLPNGDASFPELLISSSSVTDVRREPSHTAELVTQVICGDQLTPLKEEGDWFLTRVSDGYIGWVRSWHLRPTTGPQYESFRRRAGHRIRINVAQVFDRCDEDGIPVTDAVVGTALFASPGPKRGWRSVELADGRTGFIRGRMIEPISAGGRVIRKQLATTGLRFIGIPYLWGGTTPKGFDCSGLVQRVYGLHGVPIPRDSDQQARFGHRRPVGDVERLRTGDLLFFGKKETRISHVAMYLSEGLFLHAYGQVKIGSLDPLHPLYESKLVADWRVSRDPVLG